MLSGKGKGDISHVTFEMILQFLLPNPIYKQRLITHIANCTHYDFRMCFECCNVAAARSTSTVSPSGTERSETSAAHTAFTSAKTLGMVPESIVAIISNVFSCLLAGRHYWHC